MAAQKPLVIIGGQVQQIPAGDTLTITASEVAVFSKNSASQTLVIGCPVYSASATTVEKAAATSLAASKVIGLMQSVSTASGASGFIQSDGIMTATTGQWDAIAGTTGGLAFGTDYFLSGTAGLLTATPPTAAGSYVVHVGRGISTTELELHMDVNSVLLS